MSQGEVPKEQALVAPAAPRLPSLLSESLESWIIRAEANFSTSRVTVSRTKVEYAVSHNVIPEDVLKRCYVKTVYDATDPWVELKNRLRVVLGQDPLAVFSRFMSDGFDSSSGLARFSDASHALDSLEDWRSTALKWTVLRLLPVSDHESFLAAHGSKGAYEFASQVDLYRSRRTFYPEINAVPNQSKGSSKKLKNGLCFYHARFGKKALRCEKGPACPPLVGSVEVPLTPVNNVFASSQFSSDSE